VALFDDPDGREAVEDECADVLFFLLRLADRHDIDLEAVLRRRLARNAERTPRQRIEAAAEGIHGRASSSTPTRWWIRMVARENDRLRTSKQTVIQSQSPTKLLCH
jgi:hypothetical protein